jgi:predicted RND superfamily exporter protein
MQTGNIQRGEKMKRSLLTGFRALAFALGAFVLLALGGIKIQSSLDVALFVIGLAAFWFLIERVFLNAKQKKPTKPGGAA